MWNISFRLKSSKNSLSFKLNQYNIIAHTYVNKTEEKNPHFYQTLILNGDQNQIKRFLSTLEDDSYSGNIVQLEKNDTDFIKTIPEEFFMLKPIIYKDGYEYWSLSDFSKKSITQFAKELKSFKDVDDIIVQNSHSDQFLYQTIDKISDKSITAFNIAKSEGYYEFPRKIQLDDLAKKYNIPRTTFLTRLRIAEKKILSELILD